jgi:hypothetical protein
VGVTEDVAVGDVAGFRLSVVMGAGAVIVLNLMRTA